MDLFTAMDVVACWGHRKIGPSFITPSPLRACQLLVNIRLVLLHRRQFSGKMLVIGRPSVPLGAEKSVLPHSKEFLDGSAVANSGPDYAPCRTKLAAGAELQSSRLGGLLPPASRTTGHTVPYHGGSQATLKFQPLIKQRHESKSVKVPLGEGAVHVRCAGVPPRAAPVIGAPTRTCLVQPPLH